MKLDDPKGASSLLDMLDTLATNLKSVMSGAEFEDFRLLTSVQLVMCIMSDGLMFCCSLGSITIAIKLMIPS